MLCPPSKKSSCQRAERNQYRTNQRNHANDEFSLLFTHEKSLLLRSISKQELFTSSVKFTTFSGKKEPL
ncbi:hypothetical protein B6259_08200 [Ruminococcaceae bacterium CPB6]|nr:hypothetical protein B6259_08200 [Ruminococcaceae bacterium CPB6]